MPTAGSVSEPIAGTAPEYSVCTVWRRQREIGAATASRTTAWGGGFPLDSADSDELDVRVPSAVAELNDAQVSAKSAMGTRLCAVATVDPRGLLEVLGVWHFRAGVAG